MALTDRQYNYCVIYIESLYRAFNVFMQMIWNVDSSLHTGRSGVQTLVYDIMLSMLYHLSLHAGFDVDHVPCSHKNKVTQWEHPLMSLDDKDTEGKCRVCVSHCSALDSTLALAAIINPPILMHYLHFKHMMLSTNAGNCFICTSSLCLSIIVLSLLLELPEGWEVVTSEQYGIYYVK